MLIYLVIIDYIKFKLISYLYHNKYLKYIFVAIQPQRVPANDSVIRKRIRVHK